tara:strand:+ start:97 stop:912 length:816 start_codon:yes stop_codon:yes gene_type:complete
MTFFNAIRHLLPSARAWRLTVDKKLRQFFRGLSGVGDDAKTFIDDVWLDVFPQSTRELDRWDKQFGLPDTGITGQQRRDRLGAAWKALGGQSPRYIQDTLQGNGFNVFVHEWWVPGTEPPPGVKQCVTPRNPRLVLREEFTGVALLVECGEAVVQCGEAVAQAGESLSPRGYPLVNKVFVSTPDILPLCGEVLAAAGEPTSTCGNYSAFREGPREYLVPNDPSKWPYFLYIGAETFGDLAQVDSKRRDEFEALCLKICPTQQWLGILVDYN